MGTCRQAKRPSRPSRLLGANGFTPCTPSWPLAVLAAGLAIWLVGCTPEGHANAAETTVAHGPFTLVASPRRISTGSFPNQGGSPFATTEVTDFTVRWRGQPVSAPGARGSYWRALRIEGAPEPALLLVTTGFMLLREHEGQLQWQTLRSDSASLAELQWLDSNRGQPGPSQSFGIERVAAPEAGTRLAGGRWLRLGSRTVLDVRSLTAYPIEPWVPMLPGRPVDPLGREGDEARAFAPDESAYVLAASGYDHENQGRRMYGLLVVDIARGTARALRLDRHRTRFADSEDLTPAWVAHHFAWQPAPDGTRLVPRAGVAPWPWHGRLRETSTTGAWQVDVPRIDGRFADVVRSLLRTRWSAVPVPPPADAKAAFLTGELRVGSCTLSVRAAEADARPEEQQVTVWNDAPSPPPSSRGEAGGCGGLMRELAQAIDAELASGRHDKLLQLDEAP